MPNAILNYAILIIVILVGISFYNVIDTYLKNKNEIFRYQVDTQHKSDKSASQILEDFIGQCFAEYQIIVLIPKQELYINSDREKEICTDLGNMISKYISPHLINVLSQEYNTDMLHDIIADKIYIIVTNYVINHNATIGKE